MLKQFSLFVLFVFLWSTFSLHCGKDDSLSSSPNSEKDVTKNVKIDAGISNLIIKNNAETVVCSDAKATLRITLNSALPTTGITVTYTLTPSLETADPVITGTQDFLTGTSITIDLTNKIRRGEVYAVNILLQDKGNASNQQTIPNFKIVWQ